MKNRLFISVLALSLAACNSGGDAANGAPGDQSDTQPFSGIGEDEVVYFTGTEPFWNGEVSDGRLTYSTPEDMEGTVIRVDRFAGRNGVSFTGRLADQDFVLAVTPGECSDGMSDRTYPYVATLMVRGEDRAGCAYTDQQPFEGPGEI
ncbi:putative membrane protein [Altererythrobacter atlanticus]|uniref:Uncharacterized protein n=1 Tax=Croceibacterium atlanticum TaxID=1267766 RepID=A0A0F7KZ07_9SPHN|nr:hypothetical protein [Croceibacterium atlanticum]AKH44060.1 hypothetical protein WYH_03040 [Croceibacterium atlanticum]MBB5732368.1 putative membrane protein [Croceibacterium atlanticum]